jgi:L-ascorbate metabolism protein UlaG (beta-lactamase superfamily)
MNRIIWLGAILLLLTASCEKAGESKMAFETDGLKIEWLGHSAFRLSGERKTAYIDPFQLAEGAGLKKADVILITHEHYDHCSRQDVAKIITSDTIVATVADCQSKLAGLSFKDIVLVEPNNAYDVAGLKVATVPAYNIDKKFHQQNNSWVGFVLTLAGKRVYHAGDSDFIPEMKSLKGIDIAMMPVGGNYTMAASEAAAAVNSFKPKVAIPMHYGAIQGTAGSEAAENFKREAKVEVVILEKAV